MRLPKKLYPFAIIISLTLVLIVFYLLNQGHLEQVGYHPSISPDVASQDGVLYISYDMVWTGYGEPKLKEVRCLNDAGNELIVTPYIETSSNQITGILTEEEMNEGNYIANLTDVNDYKLADPTFRIVLKLDLAQEEDLQKIAYLQITYNTFGIVKEQTINVGNRMGE